MKPEYERTYLTITEFDKMDVITTSAAPENPMTFGAEKENAYCDFRKFGGSWF